MEDHAIPMSIRTLRSQRLAHIYEAIFENHIMKPLLQASCNSQKSQLEVSKERHVKRLDPLDRRLKPHVLTLLAAHHRPKRFLFAHAK